MTTQPTLVELLDRLASVVSVRRPATEDEIGAVERRLGIRVSTEFRAAYLRLDGTVDGAPLENGWFELWSVSRWYSVREYVKDWNDREQFDEIADAVVFADYSIESWHYAALFSSDRVLPSASIYLLHLQPYLVARSLGEFLAEALVDGPGIYPPQSPA